MRERLSGAETVLLLDNCEHVVAGVAALVESLLDAVPSLHVLATSQVSLGVEDEYRHQLQPLTQDESVALFLARAQALRRSLVLDAAATAVVENVCRSLDGLPLAIELAAARVRSLSVRDIARRLEDRFALLRDPSSHRPERRRALEGAIGWSYEMLFPDDQRGLWALSCFAGGATLARSSRCSRPWTFPPASVLDTIARLVDRSLVSVDSTDGGDVRYRLLDSIRAYAAARLRESGHADLAAAAHAAWYAETADWCESMYAATSSRPAWQSRGPNDRTPTSPWPGAWPTTHSSASASPTGSAGPGWSSATARPELPGCERPVRSGTGARPGHRSAARRMAGGVAGDVALAQAGEITSAQ